MARFWDFVSRANPTSNGSLPLVHTTDLYCFRGIRDVSELRPTECDVYRNEQILYFFYGRPSYRPHAQKDTVTAKALLPVCLVMSREILDEALRIMPFDTGAFARQGMHPPMHGAMAKEDFELALDARAPMKLINLFYETERNYYYSRAKPVVEGYDDFDDLEVDSYFRLLHHRANTPFDDRVTAVEVQSKDPVQLEGRVLAAILPKPFLDRPGIVEQVEAWGAVAIPYNVKEEFVPKEIQGSIFDRLTDFLQERGLLDFWVCAQELLPMEDIVRRVELKQILRVYDSAPGFAIPLFAEIGTGRYPLAQAISADGCVAGFVDFDTDGQLAIDVDSGIKMRLGECALLAFERADGTVELGSRVELSNRLRDLLSSEELREHPFLRSALAEFCGDAQAMRVADNESIARLVGTARTQSYLQVNILARDRIKRSMREMKAPVPVFRITERAGNLKIVLLPGSTESDRESIEAALESSEGDLAEIFADRPLTWQCEIGRGHIARRDIPAFGEHKFSAQSASSLGISQHAMVAGRDIVGIPPEHLPAIIAAAIASHERLNAELEASVAELERQLGATQEQVLGFFRIIGEAEIPVEAIPARLVEIAERYKELLRQTAPNAGDDAEMVWLKAELIAAMANEDLERANILHRAIEGYQSALLEYTRERAPLAWAMTQNNLGNSLRVLGEGGDDDALRRAVAAYEAALLEYTRERAPLEWAMAQNNLAAMRQHGLRTAQPILRPPADFRLSSSPAGTARPRTDLGWAGFRLHIRI